VRGAQLANDGKAVIALPSSAKNGTVSRIVSQIQPGAGVVTTRGHVQYVATEYGVVNLAAQPLRRRAELLISIAHPDMRSELSAAAKERHISLPSH
jgi:acyl-CoA hydrolase